jgi:hypothetical protein
LRASLHLDSKGFEIRHGIVMGEGSTDTATGGLLRRHLDLGPVPSALRTTEPLSQLVAAFVEIEIPAKVLREVFDRQVPVVVADEVVRAMRDQRVADRRELAHGLHLAHDGSGSESTDRQRRLGPLAGRAPELLGDALEDEGIKDGCRRLPLQQEGRLNDTAMPARADGLDRESQPLQIAEPWRR